MFASRLRAARRRNSSAEQSSRTFTAAGITVLPRLERITATSPQESPTSQKPRPLVLTLSIWRSDSKNNSLTNPPSIGKPLNHKALLNSMN